MRARALLHQDPAAAAHGGASAARRFRRSGRDVGARADAVAFEARATARRQSGAPDEAADLVGRPAASAAPPGCELADLYAARGASVAGRWTTRGARLRRVRTDSSPAASRLLLRREVRADPTAARARVAVGVRPPAGRTRGAACLAGSFGSLDLQTGVVGHGMRLAVRGCRWPSESRPDGCSSSGPSGPGCWPRASSRCGRRRTPAVADLAELGRAGAGARGGAAAPIRRAGLAAPGVRRGVRPRSLADLQSALGADTALVAYVVTADRVVGAGGHRRARGATTSASGRAGAPSQRAAARPRHGRVRAAGPLAPSCAWPWTTGLKRLADLLVAPLLADLAIAVVLTPSGVLAGMPWTLLPGLAGRPVTVAQSATSWWRGVDALAHRSAGFVAGPRVARAEEEVRGAARPGRTRRARRGRRHRGAVSDLAGRVDVLHIAAHGRHAVDNPLFSGLELVDGTLFGYDIDQMPDCRTWCCSRPARSAARRCAGARSRSA